MDRDYLEYQIRTHAVSDNHNLRTVVRMQDVNELVVACARPGRRYFTVDTAPMVTTIEPDGMPSIQGS